MNIEKRVKQRMDNSLNNVVANPYEKKRHFPLWAKFAIPIVATALTACIAVPVLLNLSLRLDNIISKLNGTYVDMEGVTAFGIGNMPEGNKDKLKLKTLHYLNDSGEEPEGNDSGEEEESNDSSSNSMTEEEQELYEWEQEYDWDPTKANVLITLNDEGNVKEVVYERTNNNGVVRQSVLGNAAAMYVSNNFTYVMYVDDSTWDFWKEIDYAQEMRHPSGFHCHHEEMQTIVIHNKTGKVFALKDLIPHVNELTYAMNYTMQAHPTRDDFLYVWAMYGNERGLWFKVIYDEENGLRYEFVIPEGSNYWRPYAAREDIYGQRYVLADVRDEGIVKTFECNLVSLPTYDIYGNTLIFSKTNGIYFGNDNRAYAIHEGKLKVFGEDFVLGDVKENVAVNFEGIANEFFSGYNDTNCLNGICYHYEAGYLYSMSGAVWKVDADGSLVEQDAIEGSFVNQSTNGFMAGGLIFAFVDLVGDNELGYGYESGKLVQLNFGLKDDVPSYERIDIIEATEIFPYGHRIIIYQDEEGGHNRGYARYYLLIVDKGVASAEYVAYGNNGGMLGVAGQITEPLMI